MSMAAAPCAPMSAATSGAACGLMSSALVVPTRTTSTSAGSIPACARASRAACAANWSSRWPGPATCRSRVPVRRVIHSSATPSRSAMAAFVMICSGTAIPTAASAAPIRPASRPPVFADCRGSGTTAAAYRGGYQGSIPAPAAPRPPFPLSPNARQAPGRGLRRWTSSRTAASPATAASIRHHARAGAASSSARAHQLGTPRQASASGAAGPPGSGQARVEARARA